MNVLSTNKVVAILLAYGQHINTNHFTDWQVLDVIKNNIKILRGGAIPSVSECAQVFEYVGNNYKKLWKVARKLYTIDSTLKQRIDNYIKL